MTQIRFATVPVSAVLLAIVLSGCGAASEAKSKGAEPTTTAPTTTVVTAAVSKSTTTAAAKAPATTAAKSAATVTDCNSIPLATINSYLGSSFTEAPDYSSISGVTSCNYMDLSGNSSVSIVTIDITKSQTHALFVADANSLRKESGYKVTDLSGLGDEAVSVTSTAAYSDTTIIQVRKGSVGLTLSSSAPAAKNVSLAKALGY